MNENSKDDCKCSLDNEDWAVSGSRHGSSDNADWKISATGKVGVNDPSSKVTLLPAAQQPNPDVFVLNLTVVEKKGSQNKCTKLKVSYSDEEWRPVPHPNYVRIECDGNSLELKIKGWDA